MNRVHKIKSDFGMFDYHKAYEKNHKKIKRTTFSDIITAFHLGLQELIITTNLVYNLPRLNFQLIMKKELRKPTIKNGKLLNNIPPDWKRTMALWERDKEAKEKKLIVRHNNSHTSGYIFRIYFKKFSARLKYKNVYKFNVNRDFKRSINAAIRNPDLDIDAYLLYNKDKQHV